MLTSDLDTLSINVAVLERNRPIESPAVHRIRVKSRSPRRSDLEKIRSISRCSLSSPPTILARGPPLPAHHGAASSTSKLHLSGGTGHEDSRVPFQIFLR